MQKITYVGLERCDFIYHLANILSLQGSVLVIDNSYNLDLMDAVSTTGAREIREWRNIVYANDIDVKNTDINAFDFVIVYAGMAFDADDLKDNDYTLVMPDYTNKALMTVAEKISEEISNPIFILRDKCSKKMTTKSISHILNVTKKDIEGWMNLSTQDMAAYVSLTHNHYSNIMSVSDEMREALKFVIAKIFNIDGDKRRQEKILKAAVKIK